MKNNGHLFSEIKGYTLEQMLFFYAEALKSRIAYMQDVRSAVWADTNDFKKYIDDIV